MGNFKAAALLAVAAILGVSSLASQHHGPSPDLPDFRQPNESVLEESMVRFNHNVARNFSSLVFDVTRGQLIVAARDYLFRLSLDGLTLLEESRWSADEKAIFDCQLKVQRKDDCHNFIRVLHIHGDRVLACGTNALWPRCSWRPVEAINNVSEWSTGVDRCPYSPHSHMSSLLSSGPAGTADLFIGSPTDFSGQDVAIFRLPLNSSVSSTSANSSVGPQQMKGSLRTMRFNAKWLNDDAEFVASVEVDQFVFFFFREVAVEVSNCGKAVYSRVARVCKNDVGQQMLKDRIWTTFVKARLNCSVPDEYPFYYDHIQGVVYVEEERLFYAAFTTAENSIAGSAVCSFTLDAMQESFAGPFKFQSSPNSTWESVNSTYVHSHCNSVEPSSSPVEAGKYQLMDRAVQSRPGKYGSKPLIQLDLERFNHIAVDVVATKNHSSIHVLYVASGDGFVRKYSVLPSTQERCLVEIVDPFARLSQPADRQIKTMQFLKVQNALYMGTKNEVIRLASQRCKRFANRTQCLDFVDPYCGWQSQLGECSPQPDNNPHASCWEQQTLTTCPTSISPEEKGVNGESSTIVGGGGVCGCNESSIIAKLAEQVKQGAPGVDNKPGMTGIPGTQGQTGPTEPEGPAGEKGERGDSGPIGKEGPSGPKGEPGRDGPPGDLGKPGLPGAKGDRGTDGEMGPTGNTGEPGLPGTKGEIGPACPVGPSVISSVEGAKGNQGDRGKRGKPGPPGPPGPPSEPSKSGPSQGGEESQKVVAPGIVTVTNMEALFKISDVSPVGTIAYLLDEESLLLRVRKGWQYISMGKFVPLPTPTMTTTIPPSTTLKKSAPSAAENMIPKIPRVPGLRLVALNEPLTGNMGGIQRVDSACYRQARQAGLRGTFRAFLASRVQKIDKIVRPPYRGYPVINLRGEMLFRTWNDLFHGRSASELSPARQQRHDIYSFNNRNIFDDIVWPQKVVWHGAGPSGQRQLDSYCDAWTSSDAKTLGVAASLIASSPSSHQQQQQTGGGGGGKLLAQDKFSCQNRFVVLCIEVTSQVVASGWVKRVVEHFEQKTI